MRLRSRPCVGGPGHAAARASPAAGAAPAAAEAQAPEEAAAPEPAPAPAAPEPSAEAWIDERLCTACDECVNLNGAMFAYNDSKKAVIADPNAGPYSDLVKAAEKCTAQVIHPGLPADRSDPDILRWIERAAARSAEARG